MVLNRQPHSRSMKKIVIASDSFKGCAASAEIAEAAEAGIRRIFPRCRIIKIPVADGGEGTVDALVAATNGQRHTVMAHGPSMEPLQAVYGILGDARTAVIETAAASGLALLAPEARNPMQTSTFGTGELIRDALLKGCRKFLIGLGGSATNDAGTGLLQALGYRFYDADGKETEPGGGALEKIERIDSAQALPELAGCSFTALCDVTNPFYGPTGAAYVFAPQKGASPAITEQLDKGLRHFAQIIRESGRQPVDDLSGAGAAGGLGGGLAAFLGARLQPGIETILKTLHFENIVKGADWVITGEGRLDIQTTMGKVVSGIAAAAARQGVPVIALGGALYDADALNRAGIRAVFPVLPYPVTLQEAMDKAFTLKNIDRTMSQLCRLLSTRPE